MGGPPMMTHTALPRIFDDDGSPARDVCHRCGYALIGLPHDHPCPECGTPPLPDIYIAFGGKTPPHPAFAVALIVLMMIGYWLPAPDLASRWLGGLAVLACGVGGVAIVFFHQRRAAAFPAPDQLRFNDGGLAVTASVPSSIGSRSMFMIGVVLVVGASLIGSGRSYNHADLVIVAAFAGLIGLYVLVTRATAPRDEFASLCILPGTSSVMCKWSSFLKLTLTDLPDGLRIHAPYGRRTAMALSIRVLDIPIRATPDQRERLVAFITRAIETSGSGATIARVRKEIA